MADDAVVAQKGPYQVELTRRKALLLLPLRALAGPAFLRWIPQGHRDRAVALHGGSYRHVQHLRLQDDGRRAVLRRLPSLALGGREPAAKGRRGRHGIFRPAADQRPDARLDLRAHRHRLHHGVRHHRHGELRPWRRLHGLGLHRPHFVPAAHAGVGRFRHRARASDRARPRHGADGAVELGDRARRLPAARGIVPARAAHLGDRHVDLPVEPRAGRAGPAQQAGAADAERGDLAADRQRQASPCR